ncbi:polysaccharide lyase 6 family protein [Lutimonas zeaxanthinifaciens]|uniref:polysaccharide lyase 6 family protein n=1 Tax=Lutimonas zeaxanthinifaciens TaxID=3060215 RepID=UPI00265CEC3E|nr:polysaccharide lyase 6 family protein [Lutimonas sp. YSD2104]WKK66440.1 polysaccharide lyase 6 family protein [Lutimonas sp. YSD2104]
MGRFFNVISIISFCSILLISCESSDKGSIYVSNLSEFNKAVQTVKPGGEIVMADGIWENVELLFEARGSENAPIRLRSETKGAVFLEGQSNLRISGEYLIVEGLVFRNGYTETNEVISFRKDENSLSNHCRLTECVIDNYSNPERHEQDTWVVVYGKHNRVDHNHFVGKRNLGVTMTVRLNTEDSRENFHRIDHNYFGPRENLGANGGETLRIGTSHYSLTNSNTLVENNFFDRCSGEHEIISNKSCRNTFRNNVFYECSGTLTMRHGNETMVDGNVFIGNNKPSTGGIRVINEKQTVINNYGIGLKGYRFRGAFVVMNGVPNSPINRYFQVDSASIRNNVFVNCDHIQLGAGSDEERSAVPINSVIEGNVFYHDTKNDLFTIYDDISGIKFANNYVSENINHPFLEGVTKRSMKLNKDSQGFLIPEIKGVDFSFVIDSSLAKKESTGVNWYSKEDKTFSLGSGRTIEVPSGRNTLNEAVKNSKAGDILRLASGEDYILTKTIYVNHPITFEASFEEKARILFEKKSPFVIENGGSLSFKGILFDGKIAPDYSGNSVIRTSKYSMNKNYKIFIDDCAFKDLNMNHSFDVIKVFKNTFADTISITNSEFRNITGHVVALDKEIDDKGVYNAEYVILKNNIYSNIEGTALNLYRGGTDESTFGPFLEIDHCVFDQVGHGKRNKSKTSISLHGVQVIDIKNNIFKECMPIKSHLVVGEPVVNIRNNNLYKTATFEITGDQDYNLENVWNLKPDFDEGTYQLTDKSALKNKGTDLLNLGLISELP